MTPVTVYLVAFAMTCRECGDLQPDPSELMLLTSEKGTRFSSTGKLILHPGKVHA